jgi:ribosomal protein L7/L12
MQDELPPDARLALQRGNLIEAIKIVRDRTGLGLKESKELVERHANAVEGEPAPQTDEWNRLLSGGAQGLPAEAIAALAQGRKVEAVKIVREATGLGLAESLKLVDEHMHGERGQSAPHGAFDPMAEPGRVPSGGGAKWLAIVLVVAVAAAVFFFVSA